MAALRHLPLFLDAASTCDDSYFDNGKACVWRTFLCEDYNNTGIIPASLQTCFSGSQQSPINLDVSQAIVGDPGQINFTGYTDQLGSTGPFVSVNGYAIELWLETPIGDPVTGEPPTISGGPLGENRQEFKNDKENMIRYL